MPGLTELSKTCDATTQAVLLALPNLYGDVSVLDEARKILPKLPGITRALDDLQKLADMADSTEITIDLADMRGYQYHSGVMFAAYVPGLPNALARGGRYDQVGEAFGRARPATGFTMDLRELALLVPCSEPTKAIRAPWGGDAGLRTRISQLRAEGQVVIQGLPDEVGEQEEFVCDRELVQDASGAWVLKNLN